MEKKVIVMSSADVAAMRQAHKEAETAYFKAKVGALEFAVSEMKATGKEYTLHELATLTGLSPAELMAQLARNNNCKAAYAAGVHRERIRRDCRETERKFVEIMPNGEINPNSIKIVTQVESTFKVVR